MIVMDKLLVSVVIPVYNGERYLAAAINSVLRQDYGPLEIIVVDDGSIDRCAEIAKSFQGVKYTYQENQGHAAARNTGIASAIGDFIGFLDADDLWTPEKISKQVDRLKQHPSTGYVISKMRYFLEPGVETPKSVRADSFTKDHIAFVPSALLVRRSVLHQIGGFDASYRHGNDSDWFFRAKDAGIQMEILPEVLLKRRIHASNLSHEILAMQSELLRVVRTSIARKKHGI